MVAKRLTCERPPWGGRRVRRRQADAKKGSVGERYLPTRGDDGISRSVAWTLAMVALQ
jgi:hypothetical protein